MIDSRNFPWDKFDVMITDPPYAPNVYESATSQSTKGGTRHRDLGHEPLTRDLMQWTSRMASCARTWSCIFTDLESVGDWKRAITDSRATYIRAIPWVRWSMPQLSGDRPPQGAEMIVIAYGYGKGKKSWNGPGNLTHFANTALRGEGKHKCEKPLDLMLSLVDFFSNEGDRVIDPFMGSGTTGLACQLLGRSFQGNEMDPAWNAKAHARIEDLELSERDAKRFETWKTYKQEIEAMKARCAEHTAKVRP